MPVTFEELCQWLLKNRASNCLKTCQWVLKNYASDYWRIMPLTVKELCQWLLRNCASDCWRIVPTAVKQSCQLSFSLFLTCFGKTLTSFSCKYFNYYYFNSGSQLSKLQDHWLKIIFIFSLYTFYQPLQSFKNLTKLNKVGIVGKPLLSGTSPYIFC